ncbi:hypothetical protein ACKKBG_A37020 [Auxenochlorella protothecoides x Auxenochlorella symbiontica]
MTEKEEAATPPAGELLVCGATDYWAIGRTKDVRADVYPNLQLPHKFKAMQGIRVSFIAAGSSAFHSVIADTEGRCYTWGRNDKGQLGLGDTVTRNVPTLVPGLKGKKVVGGGCGRHHTVVFTDDGESYSFGLNTYGQLGSGAPAKKLAKGAEDMHLAPVKVVVGKVSAVGVGAEFSVWLSEGKLYSAGLPQYGQLGHGTDGSYNAADSSVKIVFQPQYTPKLITALAEKDVTRLACGQNHSVAVASDGGVWTWGFGGYGRLGHRVQQDEYKPRLVETLTGRLVVPPDAIVAAGQTSSFCSIVGGQLFAWGKLKVSGDNLMYPTPYLELAGWDIRSLACGSTTFAVAATYGAEKSTITWGHSNGYCELGYGPGGKKSSANPDKCPSLEGVNTYQVAMGFGHSLFLVDPDHPKVGELPVWDVAAEDAAAPANGATSKSGKAAAAPAGKRKAAGAASAGARKRK